MPAICSCVSLRPTVEMGDEALDAVRSADLAEYDCEVFIAKVLAVCGEV